MEDIAADDFDIVITTCGFERRATFIAEKIRRPSLHVVLDYGCANKHSYDRNRSFYDNLSNVRFVDLSVRDLRQSLAQIFSAAVGKVVVNKEPRVLFDVSSCSRRVMAATLLALSDISLRRCRLSIGYALSKFDSAPDGELPSSISEPVIGDLSGWSDDLSKPPCAVIGLGFEPGRALGSLDYLEVPEVRLFMPRGPDDRFDHAVLAANRLLVEEAGDDLLFPYDVMQPNATYDKLHSLTLGLLSQYRPVLIPLGPKIFAAVCIFLAIRLFPYVCVWRSSAGINEGSVDKLPSGEISIFNCWIGSELQSGQNRPATPFNLTSEVVGPVAN